MLAIIIPFYKLVFFEKTLRSLAEQTNKQFKVYIGDDASPDDCTLLLQKCKGTFDFSYTRFETNLGGKSLTQQWERCIDLIDDKAIEWLMILGDDDVLGNNVVEEFYNNINEVNENKINVIRFATQKIDKESSIISDIYSNPKIETIEEFMFRKNKRSSLTEYIFKKELILEKKFKNFPLAWHSDVAAVFEIANFQTVFTINSSIIFIRYSDVNISCKIDNLESKNKATRLWTLFLLKNEHNFKNKKKLLAIIEKTYINDKKFIELFFKISCYYLKKHNLKMLYTFYHRIGLNLIKKYA